MKDTPTAGWVWSMRITWREQAGVSLWSGCALAELFRHLETIYARHAGEIALVELQPLGPATSAEEEYERAAREYRAQTGEWPEQGDSGEAA